MPRAHLGMSKAPVLIGSARMKREKGRPGDGLNWSEKEDTRQKGINTTRRGRRKPTNDCPSPAVSGSVLAWATFFCRLAEK
jgi:hypothetical protein